jgi:hypothetical protein
MNTDRGLSPREVCRHLGRNDEANVRTALQALRRKGVAELVPGEPKQRWRLTAPYRTTEPGTSTRHGANGLPARS